MFLLYWLCLSKRYIAKNAMCAAMTYSGFIFESKEVLHLHEADLHLKTEQHFLKGLVLREETISAAKENQSRHKNVNLFTRQIKFKRNKCAFFRASLFCFLFSVYFVLMHR